MALIFLVRRCVVKERKNMSYKTNEKDTLYSVALKFYPTKIEYGIYRINDLNNLYGKDMFLLDKMLDKPLGEMEIII